MKVIFINKQINFPAELGPKLVPIFPSLISDQAGGHLTQELWPLTSSHLFGYSSRLIERLVSMRVGSSGLSEVGVGEMVFGFLERATALTD